MDNFYNNNNNNNLNKNLISPIVYTYNDKIILAYDPISGEYIQDWDYNIFYMNEILDFVTYDRRYDLIPSGYIYTYSDPTEYKIKDLHGMHININKRIWDSGKCIYQKKEAN